MTLPVVVVNPASGGGATRRRWSEIEAAIRDGLGDFSARFTSRPGEATDLTRLALREGTPLVVALGGDGTINEVVNGFFDGDQRVAPRAALAVLPAGTGGDFFRTVGRQPSLTAAARAIAEADPSPIDVGHVTFVGNDGSPTRRYFINVASFGVSGLVVRYVNASSKRLGGKVSFYLATLRASLAYRNTLCRLRLDDGPPVERSVYVTAVGNGRFFGGGMMIAPAARLDDGRFDVVTIADVSLLSMMRHSGKVYRGQHVTMPFTTVEQASRVTAEPVDQDRIVLLDVDGEAPGRLPATFQILPAAILARFPPGPR